MSEIRRSDSMNIDHVVEYLKEKGISPDNTMLTGSPARKAVGVYQPDIDQMPILVDNNLRLSDTQIKKKKFRRVE